MGTSKRNAGDDPAMEWQPIQRGVEINLAAPWHGNRDKFQPNEPIGSYSDLTLLQN